MGPKYDSFDSRNTMNPKQDKKKKEINFRIIINLLNIKGNKKTLNPARQRKKDYIHGLQLFSFPEGIFLNDNIGI